MRKPEFLKSIRRVISSGPGRLNRLADKASEIKRLNTQLDRVLPNSLIGHCRAAGVHNHTLILYADSAAWATKLRMVSPTLIKTMKKQGVKSVETRIQPTSAAKPSAPKRRAHMSQQTSNQLLSMAKTIQDAKLRDALERLAKRGTESNGK